MNSFLDITLANGNIIIVLSTNGKLCMASR